MSWTAADLPDLSGHTAIVTGGNSGIGWHTAAGLAAAGARVVLACRDVDRGAAAADRISRATPAANVSVRELDLARLASVQAFANGWTYPVDLLINNAGVMAPPTRRMTADGFELQFGTNHLGHYALTGLLLPALLAADAPRVVTVASMVHFRGTAAVLTGNLGGPYLAREAYGNSKLANLLFARELQWRAGQANSALTSTAAHPGLAATALVRDRQGMGANPVWALAGWLLPLVAQPAATGARPTLYAATLAEPGSYSGPQWLGGWRGPVGPAAWSAYAGDDGLASALWARSAELTGVTYDWPERVDSSGDRSGGP